MAQLTRRSLLGASAAAALAAQTASRKTMVGIQIGAVSFADEGVDPVLDILQSKAHVNTLFVAAFTYGRGIAGRQIPGQPLPDSPRVMRGRRSIIPTPRSEWRTGSRPLASWPLSSSGNS